DDMIIAESYTDNWTFFTLHTTHMIQDMRPLIRAMDLKEWKNNPTRHKCYEVNRNAAWLAALTKMSLFVPAHMRNAQPMLASGKPMLLHLRDNQTLIFANPEPMSQYLRADGKIEAYAGNTSAGKPSSSGQGGGSGNAGGGGAGQPGNQGNQGNQGSPGQGGSPGQPPPSGGPGFPGGDKPLPGNPQPGSPGGPGGDKPGRAGPGGASGQGPGSPADGSQFVSTAEQPPGRGNEQLPPGPGNDRGDGQ